MTPQQRNAYNVRSALRFMKDLDVAQAAENLEFPAWARKIYMEELNTRGAVDLLTSTPAVAHQQPVAMGRAIRRALEA